ncbi:hypothetical protein ACQ4PT_044957 [Festuca glaucescens]
MRVLLDRKAYLANLENATTATATSRIGHTVKVTFCLADPPSLSHFCVHGPTTEHLAVEPQVVFSEKDLALLVFVFTGDSSGNSTVEYFIYKAGRGNRPSLRPIPATPPGTRNTKYVSMVVCDDGEFFLADLCVTSTTADYDLSIFSSKTDKWITRTLQVQAPAEQLRLDDMFMVSHKAISRGGFVGWVDLWRAIIVCDILADDPFIFLIPLPKPDFNLPRKGDPKLIRDVIGNINGVIRFVEMDHDFRREVVTVYNNPDNRFKKMNDNGDTNIDHDTDGTNIIEEKMNHNGDPNIDHDTNGTNTFEDFDNRPLKKTKCSESSVMDDPLPTPTISGSSMISECSESSVPESENKINGEPLPTAQTTAKLTDSPVSELLNEKPVSTVDEKQQDGPRPIINNVTYDYLPQGIYYSLCPPNKNTDAQPFSNEDEHGNAIDLIISMMKKGNGDIQTLNQPEVTTNDIPSSACPINKDINGTAQSFCNDDDDKGNDEVIFEHDTMEEEYMFYGQGIYYSLCPPNKNTDAQPFSNEDEHGNAIDLIISMMKKGNGDIQTLNQPEVMTNDIPSSACPINKDINGTAQSFCNDDDDKGNDEVIFEHDTMEEEYMFYGQGMLNTI